MNKKDIQIEKDASVLRELVNTNTVAPEKLSAENITLAVSGQKQNKKSAAVYYRAAAIAAAFAVVAATALVFALPATRNKILSTPQNELSVNDSASTLYTPQSYDEVLKIIKKATKIRVNLYADYNGLSVGTGAPKDEATMPADAESVNEYAYSTAASSTESTGRTYSELNTRTGGVDESDIIRTDGKYLYVCSQNCSGVLILQPGEDGKLTFVSRINVNDLRSEGIFGETAKDENRYFYCGAREIFVRDGLLILTVNQTDGEKSRSGALIYDLSDVKNPVLKRSLLCDGYFSGARITGNTLVLTSQWYLNVYDKDDVTVYNSIPAEITDGTERSLPIDSIGIVSRNNPDCYCLVTTFDLSDLASEPETTSVLGGSSQIYATAYKVFFFGNVYEDNATHSEIIAFDITPEGAVYSGKYCTQGIFYDSFDIDYDGTYLRVISHRTDADTNCLEIFDSTCARVGYLPSFGEGENIYGVRFIGKTLYAVTYFQTDPLFVIDLTDPTSPVIKGELKMPGFSDYLHPVGENLLVGIGEGTDDDTNKNGTKISLYDVSVPENPVELDTVVLPDTWQNTSYRAFSQYPGQENTYLIPLTGTVLAESSVDYTYSADVKEYTGAVKFTVKDGKITVDTVYEHFFESVNDYFGAERALVINQTVYCSGWRGIAVFAQDGTERELFLLAPYFIEDMNNYYYCNTYPADYNGDTVYVEEPVPAPADIPATEAPDAAQ